MTREKNTTADDIVAIARASYEAYVAKNRDVIERLIARDFHFTSPLDNRIDRATYFARCWPNSENIAGFDFIQLVPHGDRVFVIYEGRRATGAGSAIPRSSRCAKTKSWMSRSISVGPSHTRRQPPVSSLRNRPKNSSKRKG
jgi:hypothetical protein